MKKTRIIIGLIIILALLGGGYYLLIRMGILFFGEVDEEYYKVRGIVVSEETGELNWPVLANNDKISYVYVRATKGSVYKDKKFGLNFNSAIKNKIVPGAYHEYDIDSKGETQAQHFIDAYKSKEEYVMPPAVKLFLEEESIDDAKAKEIDTELDILLKALFNKFDKKPVIYTSNETYQTYLRDKKDFDIYPIFIENTKYQPMIIDDREWSFWQYTPEGKVLGCNRTVPKSVFYSDAKDFSYFCKGDFLSQQREYKEREEEAQKQ